MITVNIPVSSDMIEHFRRICQANKKIKILSEETKAGGVVSCHCCWVGENNWPGVPDIFVMGYEIGVYMGLHNDEGYKEAIRGWDKIDAGRFEVVKV